VTSRAASRPSPPRLPRTPPAGRRADRLAAATAAGLVTVAAVVGALLYLRGRPVHASSAPLFAHWLPHAGPGTPFAVALAAVVVWRGPALADRLRWRTLLIAAYLAAAGWILSLALVDGWRRGIAGRLTTRYEYLGEVPGVAGVRVLLGGFAGRILDGGPDPWTTHVAGHPPGALLIFVGLDRIGLSGGGWAAFACVAAGALIGVAVPVTLRALGDEGTARAAVPFLVLFPGAVWIGVSADGLFAGVAATGVALLAHRGRCAAVAAGLLLASCLYLSYGLVLLAPLVLAVVVLGRDRRARLLWTVAGAAAVVAAFTAAGFWWLDGYRLVHERYYQGLAGHRPYPYWVWANLAALALSAGPAAAAIVRRAAGRWRSPNAALVLAASAAILIADVSGLSKAEVERIWLPFAIWLPAGAALLPGSDRRGWLAAQAVTALLVNHLLLTTW
jgi:hypothetical protein